MPALAINGVIDKNTSRRTPWTQVEPHKFQLDMDQRPMTVKEGRRKSNLRELSTIEQSMKYMQKNYNFNDPMVKIPLSRIKLMETKQFSKLKHHWYSQRDVSDNTIMQGSIKRADHRNNNDAGQKYGNCHGRTEPLGSSGRKAVSYTHLTLPTIYSV